MLHADDTAVWRNLTDRFPSPYTLERAHEWIAHQQERHREKREPPTNFAIVVDGRPVGGAGLMRKEDLARFSAEMGYWLGRRHWGRGIATDAARAITRHAFAAFDFERLEAGVLAWNPASCRVLEKTGFALESRQRRGAFKDGRFVDRLVYVLLREEFAALDWA